MHVYIWFRISKNFHSELPPTLSVTGKEYRDIADKELDVGIALCTTWELGSLLNQYFL